MNIHATMASMLLLFQLGLLIISALIVGYYLGTLRSIAAGAPYIPTSQSDVVTMVELAKIHPMMKVYELGSGDGRIARAVGKLGAEVIGIEINPVLVLISRLKSRHIQNVHLHYGNIFDSTYHDADVIILYMLPGIMKKLESKLEKELRPGTRVITKGFRFPTWSIHQTKNRVHLYIIN